MMLEHGGKEKVAVLVPLSKAVLKRVMTPDELHSHLQSVVTHNPQELSMALCKSSTAKLLVAYEESANTKSDKRKLSELIETLQKVILSKSKFATPDPEIMKVKVESADQLSCQAHRAAFCHGVFIGCPVNLK